MDVCIKIYRYTATDNCTYTPERRRLEEKLGDPRDTAREKERKEKLTSTEIVHTLEDFIAKPTASSA